MDRTVRRSMCLATKDRRKRRNRSTATRLRSPITRNRDRMSVGEVMGLSPAASNAVNLSEAHTLDSVRAAAANVGAGRSSRRRARSKSAKGRAKEHAHTRESRSAPMDRRRSTLASVARDTKLTKDIFDGEVTSSGDDKPPALDETSSEGEAPARQEETKEQEFVAADKRLSVIETPASQQPQWSSDDDDFIKGSDEATSQDDSDDSDYEMTPLSDNSEDADDNRRLALVLRRSLEETVEDGALKSGPRLRVWPPYRERLGHVGILAPVVLEFWLRSCWRSGFGRVDILASV